VPCYQGNVLRCCCPFCLMQELLHFYKFQVRESKKERKFNSNFVHIRLCLLIIVHKNWWYSVVRTKSFVCRPPPCERLSVYGVVAQKLLGAWFFC
jgi:hypothetical protein